MSPSIDSETIAILRNQGGYFRASDYGLIEIYGKDAPRFLQSQTTNDVLKLGELSGQLSCLLDRKAHVRAFFHLFRRHDSFRIVAELTQIAAILEQFEQYKFNEAVEVLDLSGTGGFIGIQGPHVLKLIGKANSAEKQPSAWIEHDVADLKLWGVPVHAFRITVTGEKGYFLWIAKSQLAEFEKSVEATCTQLGFARLGDEVLKIARIEAGLPRLGIDFADENLLPETGLEEEAASYTKGCFLGQEVLARVKSHGSPSRALVGLIFATRIKNELPLSSALLVDGDQAASIRSNGFSPTLNASICLAFVKREYRVPGKRLLGELNGEPVDATVTLLPFYKPEPNDVKARRLYGKALSLFPKESDDLVESESVLALRDCLMLDPSFEDAYEVLGVVLSRRSQLDEAISLMKRLAEINPDSVMAHTNLSVFYVQQGKKEEAEEEKAISMSIRMRLAAREVSLAQKDEEEKRKKREETFERMEMFKQVLAIDAEDELANYGMGSCLAELEQFAEAVPLLLKSISMKPINSLAYFALASCYEGLGNRKEAVEILEKGIEVASKRGDMTPLRQMQDKHALLKAEASRI